MGIVSPDLSADEKLIPLRLDQFLHKTGIVKSRSLAKELCDRGVVSINGNRAKAANVVSPNDNIDVKFTDRLNSYNVIVLPHGNVRKEDRGKYARFVAERLFHEK